MFSPRLSKLLDWEAAFYGIGSWLSRLVPTGETICGDGFFARFLNTSRFLYLNLSMDVAQEPSSCGAKAQVEASTLKSLVVEGCSALGKTSPDVGHTG